MIEKLVSNKRIIFFDGDGTLWYPKKTKWTIKPHLIYTHLNMKPGDYLKHLVLTPQILKTIKSLRKRGILLIVLSTHPHKRLEADMHLNNKIKHFGLDKIFDHIYSARPFPWGKGKVMESVLRKLRMPKSQTLLVGDSYIYDYLSARKVGIDCILLKTPYLQIPKGRKVPHMVKKWKELI